MSERSKFDLEPNPFERSFASKESSLSIGNQSSIDSDSLRHSFGPSNKHVHPEHHHHHHHLPLAHQQSTKLPGITPPLFTPGGRRLPPVEQISNPVTPTTNLWNSLLTASSNHHAPSGPAQAPTHSHPPPPPPPSSVQNGQFAQQNYNQFMSSVRKTGLTPNESNLRTGLTPGGFSNFGFGGQVVVPGLSTPGALLNGSITPGLSNLLGMNGVIGNMVHQVQEEQVPNIVQEPNITQQQSETSKSFEKNEPSQVPSLEKEATDEKLKKNEDQKEDQKEEEEEEDQKEKEVQNEAESETVGASLKRRRASAKTTLADRKKSKKKKKETDKKETDKAFDEDKRKSFLERNRVAASKCRQRKKQLLQKMEDELAFYSNGYREYSAQVTQLRAQLLKLKTILSVHKNCPELIQYMGGRENLEKLLNEATLTTEVTVEAQNNMTSIPSTIPTTLNIEQ